MANEQRLHRDYFFGVLSLQATISDTTLSSTAFANLPGSVYSTTAYLPLVLHNPATGAYEVVWVTAHTAASQSVTVVRGKEGTSAQAWPANTQVLDATTARDVIPAYAFASLPTDAHYGMRSLVTDRGTGVVMEKYKSGWGPSMGVALATQVGPLIRQNGVYPPDDAGIVIRTGHYEGTTDVGGNVVVTFRSPFPTGVIAATITSISLGAIGPFIVYAENASSISVRCYNGSTSAVASTAVVFTYVVTGY